MCLRSHALLFRSLHCTVFIDKKKEEEETTQRFYYYGEQVADRLLCDVFCICYVHPDKFVDLRMKFIIYAMVKQLTFHGQATNVCSIK